MDNNEERNTENVTPQKMTRKERVLESAKEAEREVGPTIVRAGANYITGGGYEKIRNAPVVGKIAKKAEVEISNYIADESAQNMKLAMNATKPGNTIKQIKDSNNTIKNLEKNVGKNDSSQLPRNNNHNNAKNINTPNNSNNKYHSNSNRNRLTNQIGSNQKEENDTGAGETTNSSIKPPVIDAVKDVTLKMPLPIKIKIIVVLIIIFFFVFLLLYVSLTFDEDSDSSMGYASGGYYSLKCQEMTIMNDDGTVATYDNDRYVAGVVAAEIGGFGNLEVYKALAIAARTYGEATAVNNNCSIANNSTAQNFKDIEELTGGNYDLIHQAVEETKGIVMLNNDSIFRSEYDAFCYAEKNSDRYVLAQKEQNIPLEWVENNINNYNYTNCPCNAEDASMTNCWSEKGKWKDGGHGKGMSQYGALYLATVENYTYDQILNYYYDDIKLSTKSFMTSLVGLDIKNTTSSTPLSQDLATFLQNNGSSIDEMNNYIKENVITNGVGTRAGVVAAAISMVNYLNDGFGVRIPYYLGGKYSHIGVNPNFGGPASSPDGGGRTLEGIDCSGFVTWSIINGGFNPSTITTGTANFDSKFSSNSCNIKDSDCIGQPGDIINSRQPGKTIGHAQLIISVDEASGKYFVAESTSGSGSGTLIREWGMHESVGEMTTKILRLDDYYSNEANINNNY